MCDVSSLFCTPVQGQRLKELVPELTSAFVWFLSTNLLDDTQEYQIVPVFHFENEFSNEEYINALTLQELRDVAKGKLGRGIVCRDTAEWDFNSKLQTMTAPELASWVIERMEGR